ncbi:MAG: hypothetical protein HY815_26230 [Candidatus Riflebacteria bacterium]|nr:hypothetical protein [Candidatus Riflebacteria bacterium]
MRLFRRIEEGVHPVLELGRALTGSTPRGLTPSFLGHLEYHKDRSIASTIGVMREYVDGECTAWQHTLDDLGRYFDRAVSLSGQATSQATPPTDHLLDAAARGCPPRVLDTVGSELHVAGTLGLRTAELHVALVSMAHEPAFAPEPFSRLYQRSLYQSMRNQVVTTFRCLREHLDRVPPDHRERALRLLASEARSLEFFDPLRRREIQAETTRYHGNLSLEGILFTGRDFVILESRGGPAWRWSDLKIKRSPLRDVASLLRSFHYAVHATLLGLGASTLARPEDLMTLMPWARWWFHWVGATFLRSYLTLAGQMTFLPQRREDLRLLLDVFCLERALQELESELVARPAWSAIPLRAILEIMETPQSQG